MNKVLYLSDGDVQSQLATRYNLLVNIGLETFQYAIIDNSHLKVLAEYEIPTGTNTKDLIRLIEDLPESGRQFKFIYKSVKVSFHTTNYTFIPAELYNEDSRKEYGKYIGDGPGDDLIVTSIRSSDIKNVIAINSEFNVALNRIFHKPIICNQPNPYLEGIQRTLKREDELACFIDVKARHFQLALFKDYKLDFYNSFEFTTVDEFNYFLLNTVVSLEIAAAQAPIYLSGRVARTDEVYQRIEKYFGDIHFISTEGLIKYSGDFQEIAPHTFFNLFSLDLCE